MGYPLILDEFQKLLEGWRAEGSISEETYEKLMGDANRIFESMLAALPEETILALVGMRFKADRYSMVVSHLKKIADERSRPKSE